MPGKNFLPACLNAKFRQTSLRQVNFLLFTLYFLLSQFPFHNLNLFIGKFIQLVNHLVDLTIGSFDSGFYGRGDT